MSVVQIRRELARRSGAHGGKQRKAAAAAASGLQIPSIVHQVWFDLGAGPVITEKYRPAVKTVKACMAHCEYRLWSEDQALDLVQTAFPWFLKTYLGAKYDIQRVDMIRYMILYTYGGFYLDADVELFRSLKSLQRRYRLVLCNENGGAIGNFCMGSVPGHPFWIHMLRDMKARFERIPCAVRTFDRLLFGIYVLYTTGPWMLTSAWKSYKKRTGRVRGAARLDSNYFGGWSTRIQKNAMWKRKCNAFGRHHYAAQWVDYRSDIYVFLLASVLFYVLLRQASRTLQAKVTRA